MPFRRRLPTLALICCALILALFTLGSCKKDPAKQGAGAVPATAQSSGSGKAGGTASTSPRQILLIYTGDTVSAVEPNRTYNPPEGGLPALANAISAYEMEILSYNQTRIANEGGDPNSVHADLDNGMLGEHPLLLLDYGGWERPNDAAGAPYVDIFFDFTKAMHYSAVASLNLDSLPPQRWAEYLAGGKAPPLLATTGTASPAGLTKQRIWVRELLGSRWGAVAIPELSAMDKADPDGRVWKASIEQAAQALKDESCDSGILIAVGLPRAAYEALAKDARFTILLGGPSGMQPQQGYGPMPLGGPLMLPMLFGGGRQIGICHLITTEQGSTPVEYNFMLRQVIEDETQPFPFRQRCAEAAAKHAEAEAGMKN